MRLRTVLIAAGVVIALPVIGLGVFVATFDANAYKPRLAAAVQEATGRELSLRGPIRLSLGLNPGVRVEDVVFANAPWGSRPEMARLAALEVEVSILPLLSGTVAVNRVVLVSPDILLETDAEGRGNWEIAAPQARPAAPSAPGPGAPAPAPQREGAGRELHIGALDIRDGTVVFRDGRTGQTTTLGLPRLAMRAGSRSSPVSLDLAASVNGNEVTLAGSFGPLARLAAAQPGAPPWPVELTVTAAGARAAIRGSIAEPTAAKGFDLSVEAMVPDLARLAPLLPGVALPPVRDVALSVQAADRGGPIPEIRSLTLRVGASDLGAVMSGLRLSRLEVAAPDTRSPVRLALAATLGGAAVSAEGTLGPLGAVLPGAAPAPWPVDLRLGAAGAQATLKGTIADPRAAQGVDLAVAATIPDLAALSPLAGGAQLPAIKDVSLTARARDLRGRRGASLSDIALKLGPSDLAGSAEIALGARPKLTADLRSRLIDADSLLAALDGGASAGGGRTTTTAPPPQRQGAPTRLIPDTMLPFAGLRAADAAVTFAVAELVLGGARYREAQARVALDAGRLRVDPFRVAAPGAAVTASLSVDAATDEAPVALVLRAPAIDLRELVAAHGGGYRVSGTLELDLDLRGRGASPAAIAAGLAGHVGLAGANLDIDNRLIDLIAGEVWRALVPGAPRDGTNNVRCLALRFDSTAGTAEARAFLFDSALAKVAGTGQVLLGPEQLRLRLVPTLKLAGGGLGVPVNLGGTFLAPSVRVDAAGVAAGVAGALAGAGAGAAAGAAAGPLGAIVGGVVGAARPGAVQAADECAAQLAIARGGRQGAVPAEAGSAPTGSAPAAQDTAPAAPTQQQRPANPLQQILPRLGR